MARRRRNYKKRNNKKYHYSTNENIRAPKVRLVGEDLEELSDSLGEEISVDIYPTKKALAWAREAGLDLVLISPKAKPPVVKIIDYKKFVYDKKKREKAIKAKAQKTVIKELRFGPNTDDHDFNFKLKHAKNFLKDGCKVKAFVHFRGRSIVFKERGELLLLRLIKELDELGSAESLPKMEGRRMNVMISPDKK